jgi:hypothetical protein
MPPFNIQYLGDDLIYSILLFLDAPNLLLIRSVCKYIKQCTKNKILWKPYFDFAEIVKKSVYITNFQRSGNSEYTGNSEYKRGININTEVVYFNDPPSENDKYVTGIEYYSHSNKHGHELFKTIRNDFFKSMHTRFPNLIYVSLDSSNNLAYDDMLNNLSKIKKLMFVSLYETFYLDYLRTDKIKIKVMKEFLDKCPNLQEVDFASQCGLPITIKIDGMHVDFMWDKFKDVLDNKINIDEIKHNSCCHNNCDKYECDKNMINVRDYPNIRSWDKCRYSIDKIPVVKLIENVEKILI